MLFFDKYLFNFLYFLLETVYYNCKNVNYRKAKTTLITALVYGHHFEQTGYQPGMALNPAYGHLS